MLSTGFLTSKPQPIQFSDMKMVKQFFFLFFLLLAAFWCRGQAVQLRLTMPPPYSVHLEDYLAFRARSIVTLTNMTDNSLQLKLIGAARSLDGRISVQVSPNYQPAAPIILGPRESRVLTGEQLRSLNININPNDLSYQGIDPASLLRSGTMPEGFYQFCLRAHDYQNNSPLSQEFTGCATIQLSNYDPPIIVQPADAATVTATNPQLLNFAWTPAGLPGTTRYTLRLVDMTETGLFNPNDAFSGIVLPYFERSNLFNNTYTYTIADLPLKNGHQYAVQVEAYDPSQSIAFNNLGRSAVTTFTWQALNIIHANDIIQANPNNQLAGNMYNPGLEFVNNNPGSQPNPPNGNCVATTLYQGALGGSPKPSITNGTDILVGHFVMKNTLFTKNNGGSFNGTGTIQINFLNLMAEVSFQGIQVNGSNRLIGGKITAKVSANHLVNNQMANTKEGLIESLPDAQGLFNFLENANHQVSQLSPNVPKSLPLSLDGDEYNVGIVGLIFEPNQAYLNAVLPIPVPQAINGQWLNIGSKGIPIQPNGWGNAEVKVALSQGQSFPLSDKLALHIEGGTNKTFATLDCSGFHSLQISGAFEVAREAALPLDNNYQLIADASVKVKVPFQLSGTTRLEEFLLDGADFSHPFSIPDARDFVFQAGAVSIDFASAANGAAFKTAFPNQGNDWVGLFVKDLTLILPEGFKKNGGGRISVQLKDLAISKQGVAVNAQLEGQPIAQGNLVAWGFDLEMVNLALHNSKLAGGGLGGRIRLPLGEQAEFGFAATVSKGDAQGAKYNFSIETGSAVEADLFLATIVLHEGSTIHISQQNGKFQAASSLNGTISVGFSEKKAASNVGKMDVPELKFQELSITGKDEPGFVPQFDLQFASLNSQGNIQAKIGSAFEMKLHQLNFQKKTEGGLQLAGLQLGFGLSLFGGNEEEANGIGANTTFTAWAKYDADKRTFVYHKAQLDELVVEAELGVAFIKGSIAIYDEDPTFGNGFRGGVKAELRGVDAGVEVNVQFGRTLANKGNYKYWYFDAMVNLPSPGLNIPSTPLSFYGFGGGAWCNMSRSGGVDGPLSPTQYQGQNGGQSGAPTVSGANFTPQKGKGGFKASVLLGMTGKKEAFNADLTFSMTFNTINLGVTEIRLDGDGYIMQDVSQMPRSPQSAIVRVNVEMSINIPNRTFMGVFGVAVNASSAAQGSGTASLYFQLPQKDDKGNVIPSDKLKWHMKLGWWTPGANPFSDPNRLNGQIGFDNMVAKYNLKFQGYIMAGNDLPAGLPPLPSYIYDAVKDKGVVAQQTLPAEVANTQNLAFALGAGIQFNAGFDFKIVSADLQAEAAFDVLISNLNAKCDGEEIGFNGWYAQGQVYAYVRGEGKLFGIPVAEVGAGAVLQAKLPKPTWVKGSVFMYINLLGHEAGHYEGVFERGTKCSYVQTNIDPFAETQLIKAAHPTHLSTGVDPVNPDIWVDFTYTDGQAITFQDVYNNQTLKYKAVSYAVLKTKQGEIVPLSDFNWVGGKIQLFPEGILKGNTEYHLVVTAQIKTVAKVVAEEERVVKFGTGPAPSKFNLSHLAASYPMPRQRFFMKSSFNGGAVKGYMRLKQDLCYLINPTGKESFVEFVEASTGKTYVSSCQCDGQGGYTGVVTFNIPQTLKNQTIYHLRIYNKPVQIILQQNDQLVPAPKDYIFSGLHFRTSKYNDMASKLNSMQLAKVAYVSYSAAYHYSFLGHNKSNYHKYYVPVLLFSSDEPLDRYDTEFYQIGNHHDGTPYLGKLVREYKPQENWMTQWRNKYREFNTLSASDQQFLKGLAGNATVKRQNGFPFYGKSYTPMKFEQTDIRHMGNHAYFDMIMRANKELNANETLRQPLPPLSAAEIQQAFANNPDHSINGEANLQFGNNMSELQNQANNTILQANVTPYIPIMDFSPMVANHDKQQYDKRILQQGLDNQGFQFLKAYNLLKNLGWMEYTGNRSLEIRTWEHNNQGFNNWKTFNWNYQVMK